MSYYQIPEEALENSDEMILWASKAYEVALKTASKKKKEMKKAPNKSFHLTAYALDDFKR